MANPDGTWLAQGAAGHSLAIAAGAAAVARPAGVASQVIDVPTLGTKADVSAGAAVLVCNTRLK